MTQFRPGLFREQIEQLQQAEVEPPPDYGDVLIDSAATRRRETPYADALMNLVGGNQAALDELSGFMEEVGIQEQSPGEEPGFIRRAFETVLQTSLGETALQTPVFAQELGKGLIRGTINTAMLLPDAQLANMRAARQIYALATGTPIEDVPVLPIEREQIDARFELERTLREGFLAPKPQERIFAWDDPDWWAGIVGESFVFLLTSLGVGLAAGSAAKGTALAARHIGAVRISAGATTAGLLEANLSRADLVAALMEKGLTEEEAFPIATMGAAAVGFVNGLLEVIPMAQFLGTGQSRHLIVRGFTRMAAESGTEIAQEATIAAAETVLDVGMPGTLLERLAASGASAGPVSAPIAFTFPADVDQTQTAAVEANNEAEVREVRKRILSKQGPLTPEEQELLDVTRVDVEDDTLADIQGLNEEERTVARDAFGEILNSGLNPFTHEPMTDEQIAGMQALLHELDSVQEAIPEEPEAAEEAEPADQQERQEAEEGQKEAAADLAAEPEDQAAGTVAEPEPEADTFASTLTEVGQAFPEELSEPLARIETLNRRVDELLDQGLTREADPLIQELEGMKAEVLAELDRLQGVHGRAGGKIALASRGVRAVGDTAQASVERLVDRVRTIAGNEDFEATVAPVDPDSPEGAIVREARRIGLRVTYFDGSGDLILGAHDPYGDSRRVLLSTAMMEQQQIQSLFSHEIVHSLRVASESAWEKFYHRVRAMDPDGLREAGRDYWERLTGGKGNFDEWFESDTGRSESTAQYVEDRASDTDFYNRVVGNDRNLLTLIRDLARRLAQVLGLAGVDTKGLLEVSRLADQAAKAFKAPKTPVQFVGFQAGTENVPGAFKVNLPTGNTVTFDPTKHQITGLDPAAAEEGVTLPQALAEGVDATEGLITDQVNLALGKPRRPRGRGVKRQVNQVTGVRKSTVSEREARQLRRILKEQRKVGEQAFREGLSAAQGRVMNMLEGVFGKMGMQVTQRMIERMQKARKARSPQQVAREGLRMMEDQVRLIRIQLHEDARQKKINVAKVKRQITESVRQNLKGPIGRKMQGRFLGDVARAETATQLHVAMKRIEVAVGQMNLRQAVSDLRKAERKAKKFTGMTNDLRQQIAGILTQATAVTRTATGRLQTFSNRADYDAVTNATLDAVDSIEALLAIRRAERNQINADKARTVEGHVSQVESNLARLRELKGRNKMAQDKTTGLIRRGAIALMDVANLTRHAEGRWDGDGVLTHLLDKLQKDVEEGYQSERRDQTDLADRMIRENTGYQNLAEAQMKLQGTLGEANQEFGEVTIGGERVTLSVDILGEIVAVDARTLAGIVESGFQPEQGRQTTPLRPTLAELQAIRDEWAPKFGDLVVGFKANVQTLKPRTFAVAKELKGREPQSEGPDYWPSRRNITASPDFGLSADLRSFMQSAVRRWLENAGFLQEREGGKAPFVLRGLLRTYMDHVDSSLKVIHLAVPVRNAAAVLLNPRTVQAINRAHGSDMNEILQKHLIEATRLNQDTDGGPDRRIRTLNTNMIGTFLATNVGTYIRQIGGSFRIAARMPLKYFLAGVQNLRPGTYAEMKKHSGGFWDRYEGDSYARYSPMRGQGLQGMDFSTFGQAFGALLKSVSALDLRGAGRSWTSMMRSIKLLDWFDAIPGRIAWEGRKAQIQDEHPDWSQAQVLKETAGRAFDDMRSTQNTSSPLDSASLAVAWRNNPLRYFLLFTTDPNKSLNFLIRSWHESPSMGFKATAGVVGNMAWSAYAVTMGLQYSTDLIASMLGAAFGRDPDEAEREKQRIRSWERSNIRMASEVLGLSFFGDELVNAWVAVAQPFRRDDVFRAPIGQTISDTLMGGAEAGRSVWHVIQDLDDGLTDAEKDKFTEDMIDGLQRSAVGGSTLLGNPFLMPWYRVKPIIGQLFPEDEAEPARGNLDPEAR